MAVEHECIDYVKREVGDAVDTREAIRNAYYSESKIIKRVKEIEAKANEQTNEKENLENYSLSDLIPKKEEIERLVITERKDEEEREV